MALLAFYVALATFLGVSQHLAWKRAERRQRFRRFRHDDGRRRPWWRANTRRGW